MLVSFLLLMQNAFGKRLKVSKGLSFGHGLSPCTGGVIASGPEVRPIMAGRVLEETIPLCWPGSKEKKTWPAIPHTVTPIHEISTNNSTTGW